MSEGAKHVLHTYQDHWGAIRAHRVACRPEDALSAKWGQGQVRNLDGTVHTFRRMSSLDDVMAVYANSYHQIIHHDPIQSALAHMLQMRVRWVP